MRALSYQDFLCPKMSHTWIDHDRKLIYCKIPKNAGSTMMKVLDMSYERRYFHPADPEDFFVFTLLRDPVERFFSGFGELCRRQSLVTVNSGFWKYDDDRDKLRALVDEMEACMARNPYCFDPHIRPQEWYLSYDDGTPYRVDKFYEVANLKAAVADLRSRGYLSRFSPASLLGLPRLNVGDTGVQALGADPELLARIQAIYAQDLALYQRAVSLPA
jgi:hypothetical protein